MVPEPSVQDRVLEAFLKQLEATGAVPSAVSSRLAGLLSKSGSVSAEDIVRIIRESTGDDAQT